MLARAGLDDGHAQRQLAREIERPGGELGDERFGVVGRAGAGLDHRPRLGGRDDALVRHAVLLAERRAQRLVAGDQVADGRAQRAFVQRPAQASDERDVVGDARALDPIDQPQALLGERQRRMLRARAGDERRARGRALLAAPRQAGRRGRLEDIADPELGAQLVAHPRGEPGGQQRLAAEREEVVAHAAGLEAEDVGEQAAEHLLAVGPRGALGLGRRGLGLRQRAEVELAAGRDRQAVEDDHGRRDHVPWQALEHVGAQLGHEAVHHAPRSRVVGARGARAGPAGRREEAVDGARAGCGPRRSSAS